MVNQILLLLSCLVYKGWCEILEKSIINLDLSDNDFIQSLVNRINILETHGLIQQRQIDELLARDRQKGNEIQRLLFSERQLVTENARLVKRDDELQKEIAELLTRDRQQEKLIELLLKNQRQQRDQISWLTKRARLQRDQTIKLEKQEQLLQNKNVQPKYSNTTTHLNRAFQLQPRRKSKFGDKRLFKIAKDQENETHENQQSRIKRSMVNNLNDDPSIIEETYVRDQRNAAHYIVSRQQTARVQKVAFFAGLSNHIFHLGINQDVIFDDVKTNIGNAYNNQRGVFVAPLSGVYVISASVMAYYNHELVCGIIVNGASVSRMYAKGSNSSFDQGSATLVVHLFKGDDVTVQNVVADTTYFGGYYSMFSGFLLYDH